MPKKLILFNGPPRSGKDTAADYVWANYDNVQRIKMSGPLKRGVQAFFNLTDAELRALEETKDSPNDLLLRNSYRDVQISLSEDWAKEKFGMTVFGHLAARVMRSSRSEMFVTSDSGFDYEAVPLVNIVGPANTLLVRVHRPGFDFTKDSRSHITLQRADLLEVDVYNTGTVADFHKRIKAVIDAWLTP